MATLCPHRFSLSDSIPQHRIRSVYPAGIPTPTAQPKWVCSTVFWENMANYPIMPQQMERPVDMDTEQHPQHVEGCIQMSGQKDS